MQQKQEFPILTTRKQLEMLKLMQNFLFFFVNFAANSKTNLDSLRSETDYATNLSLLLHFFIESTTTTTSSDISQNSLYPGHQWKV